MLIITQTEVKSLTILSEPLAVVLPLDHPLAERDSIDLRSLQNESFILCPKDIKPDVRRQIIQLCTHAGFQPRIAREASPPEVQLRLVESGMGISLIAASSKRRHNARVVYRLLVEPVPVLKIAAVWHEDRQSLARANFIKNCLLEYS